MNRFVYFTLLFSSRPQYETYPTNEQHWMTVTKPNAISLVIRFGKFFNKKMFIKWSWNYSTCQNNYLYKSY